MLERITQENEEITAMRKTIAEACLCAVGEEREFSTHMEWLSFDRGMGIFFLQ